MRLRLSENENLEHHSFRAFPSIMHVVTEIIEKDGRYDNESHFIRVAISYYLKHAHQVELEV